MILDFIGRHALVLHGMVVAAGLVVYVGASRALPQRRDPSAAIAWVVGLALVPYITLPVYLMFGSRKLRMRDDPAPSPPPLGPPPEASEAASMWARRLGRSMGLAPAARYEALHVHAGGQEALQAALEVIASATRTLDVCTFILAHDAIGMQIAAALRAKAAEGVRVRLLLDGIGAWLGGHADAVRLRGAGVEVVTFVPPFRSILRGRANLRNHRKMIVADTERLWCGGRNFAEEYFDGPPPLREDGVAATGRDDSAGGSGRKGRPDWRRRAKPGWHDLSFDLSGDIVALACEQFEKDWAYATRAEPAPACAPPAQPLSAEEASLAQLVPSGPDQVDDTIQSLLLTGCYMARHRIRAVTPYFVPDANLLMALMLAARRGVLIDLVLPARSNHRLADVARHRPLRDLANAGARIWFVPWMTHAKAFVVDEQIALAGSANLDLRSLLLNYELMIAFYERSDVRRYA
ncbi:MAG TPA: phospholipase D-like domain-containing protein, partial [Caldimonas sp.]|nr:phospholipase D-like domain-containing protein [Caldimonas sp.]